jgi:hypothetical protein
MKLIITACLVAFVAADCVFDQEECPCFGRANVATVVDTTGSIGTSGNYNAMKGFLKKVVGRLGLGDNGIQTAGISFANFAILHWAFGSTTSINHLEICDAIDNLPEPKGQTNTHLAINMAQAQLVGPASDRPWACNVVLLVTDGGSDVKSALTQSIADIRDAVTDVKFCVVSIRQDDESDAKKENRDNEIAKFVGPNGQNMDANGFADLDGLVDATLECICECARDPCCPPPPPPCQADAVIIVDRTGSIGSSGNFNNILDFVRDLITALYTAPLDVKTALISFSNVANVEYNLVDPEAEAGNVADALTAVGGIGAPRGQTNTHLALEEALNQFNDARAGVNKRVVLITDGGSDVKKATTNAAAALQDLDAFRMCVVSIRNDEEPGSKKAQNRDKEIARLINGGGFNVDAAGFGDLAVLVQDIVDCVCG